MYNVANWYWAVAGSTTQVWSSQRMEYVATTDATYSAWLAQGNAPTRISSAASLAAVMSSQFAPVVLAVGVQVTSTATPALNGTYALDQVSQNQITAIAAGIAAGKGLPGAGTTFNWPDASGTPHAFSSANWTDFASAVETYIYNFTESLLTIVSGGSATMPAQPVTIP